jgi:hypothetical protein
MIGVRTMTRVAALGAAIALGVASANAEGSSGTLVEWGPNAGFDTVPSGEDFVAVSAGDGWGLALRADGSLAAWGDFYGHGVVSGVPAGTDFVAISAGWYTGFALRGDGTVARWGLGTYGLSGNDFVAVSAGEVHVVGLRSDGSLVAAGQAGLDSNGAVGGTPSGTGFVSVAAGAAHNVAIRSDGSLVSWGRDNEGQVSGTPSGTDYVAVSAGYYHSVALRADGTLVSWGSDSSYGLVSGTPTDDGFVAVAAGVFHTLALRSDGSLVSWGLAQEQTPTEGEFAAIASGPLVMVAVQFVPPPSAAESIHAIDEAVQALVEDGAPLPADGIVLRTPLRLAERFANRERHEIAACLLEVFVAAVERYVDKGRLTAVEGASLVEPAEEVIFLLRN